MFSIQLKEIAERNQLIDQVNNVKMDQPPLHVTSTIRDSFGFALLKLCDGRESSHQSVNQLEANLVKPILT